MSAAESKQNAQTLRHEYMYKTGPESSQLIISTTHRVGNMPPLVELVIAYIYVSEGAGDITTSHYLRKAEASPGVNLKWHVVYNKELITVVGARQKNKINCLMEVWPLN